jgi:hypothetical protein
MPCEKLPAGGNACLTKNRHVPCLQVLILVEQAFPPAQ